ncbi:protein of unknown function [Parapedobacter koreensis]|uniref:Uncharacterized protein n=2 Tax=Parapedobacter koreensis TaxID=332977 RepID=A0A1H7EVE0_9SPHI|nr:protein of unknown function [Parapedobacter koreensis]
MALFSIRLHSAGYNISLLFFAVHLMLLGYLVYRSALLPKIVGVLLVLAGLCYAINSLSAFLFPAFANAIFPAILVPCFLAELLFSLVLLIRGVRHNELHTHS